MCVEMLGGKVANVEGMAGIGSELMGCSPTNTQWRVAAGNDGHLVLQTRPGTGCSYRGDDGNVLKGARILEFVRNRQLLAELLKSLGRRACHDDVFGDIFVVRG